MNKKQANQTSIGISSHFEREAKIIVGFFVIFILIGLLVGLMGPWLMQKNIINKCLDKGGTFEHKKAKCSLQIKSKPAKI